MTALRDRWRSVTPGERGRLLAYLVVAIFGAAFALIVVSRLEGDRPGLLTGMSLYHWWVVISGAVGAAGGLYLSGEALGHPGKSGWSKAAWGALVTSFAGSLIAGTLALPLYGTMFGPFSLAVTLAGSPLLAVLWFGCLFRAHYLLSFWRRERDSIFRPLNRKGRKRGAPKIVSVSFAPRGYRPAVYAANKPVAPADIFPPLAPPVAAPQRRKPTPAGEHAARALEGLAARLRGNRAS
ncbi:hypothetical protein [Histidinibacterium aquaticum]|uniref:Uncharacterized protein n=1 Tax=Histidinibacterium aquaticum TaxID=2613962 RepID=A0A5J5GI36_9RHOB|nr:hypothetical protein [Histidinibacterium aquaticum]KAA9007909.1 hypothetical protein F3S47_10315 [Histidinibacterium aquaticum]